MLENHNEDEIKLINLFRKETNIKKRDKIFENILTKKDEKGRSWSWKIKNYIKQNKYKIQERSNLTDEDIYHEVLINFFETIAKHFNPNKNFKFTTYGWYVIVNTLNKINQKLYSRRDKNI